MKAGVFTPATLPPPSPGKMRYGVLGSPVAHSLSPAMQEAGFQTLGIPAEYLRVEIAAGALAQAVSPLRTAGFQGWNCTLPHKETMFALCQETDAKAKESGSVNTVKVSPQGLRGTSTDADGWEDAVAECWELDLSRQRVFLLGCGGVGRTLAFRIAARGCRSLVLANRTAEKALRLLEELRPRAGTPISTVAWNSPDFQKVAGETDLWIHATSLGLAAGDPLPVAENLLGPGLKVYDTVYRQDFTPLVRLARARGAQAADGLGMLLHQGARALSFWTGKPAPIPNMRAALEKTAGRPL